MWHIKFSLFAFYFVTEKRVFVYVVSSFEFEHCLKNKRLEVLRARNEEEEEQDEHNPTKSKKYF